MYKPEDLSTPNKRPTVGSGFIINPSKTIVLPDDQMDIDDDDDDPNEIVSDEDLRGMALPSVVQSNLKQQLTRKTKPPVGKDLRQQQDDDDAHADQDITLTRKKFQEKVIIQLIKVNFLRTSSLFSFRYVHPKVPKMHLRRVLFHRKWKLKFTIVERR